MGHSQYFLHVEQSDVVREPDLQPLPNQCSQYYQFVDNFSWVIGKHALRIGGEFRDSKFPQVGNEFPRGQFYFDSQFTNTVTPTGANSATQSGGYAGADFMLGDSYDGIIAVSLASAKFTADEWSTYIDDTWRVNPHLTLTLGFRWEVSQPLLDTSGNEEPNVQLQQPFQIRRTFQILRCNRFTCAPGTAAISIRGSISCNARHIGRLPTSVRCPPALLPLP